MDWNPRDELHAGNPRRSWTTEKFAIDDSGLRPKGQGALSCDPPIS
jgi:hypothetical protein